MLNFKTKEYTFKDANGNDINIKYNYTEKTRELLKMLTGSDIENVENLKEAKLIEILIKMCAIDFILKAIIWLSVTGFLTYNLITCAEVIDAIKYFCGLLFWVWFTCIRR